MSGAQGKIGGDCFLNMLKESAVRAYRENPRYREQVDNALFGSPTPLFWRTRIAPFTRGQTIGIPGGRSAVVTCVRINRAEGTGAFGAWMIEARPDGIDPSTGKAWGIDTFFASECRE